MAGSFLVSPGILVKETDLTDIIPAVATSPGATAGYFEWGPMMLPQSINSETNLVSTFGKPNDNTFNGFFTAANFLAYTNNLLVTRANANMAFNAGSYATDTAAANSVTSNSGNTAVTGTSFPLGNSWVGKYLYSASTLIGQIASVESATGLTLTSGSLFTTSATPYLVADRVIIKNDEVYRSDTVSLTNAGAFIAKFPGAKGNSLSVSIADNSTYSVAGSGISIKSTYNISIINCVRVGSTSDVTVTTSGNHNLSANQHIIITGAGTFNGSFTVLVAGLSSNVFRFTQAGITNDETVTSGYVNSKELFGVGATTFLTQTIVGSLITDSNNNVIGQVASITSDSILVLEKTANIHYVGAYIIKWQYYALFSAAPSTSNFMSNLTGSTTINDELHIVVIDSGSLFTGAVNTVLETYEFASKAKNAVKSDGTSNYYKNIIQNKSAYVYNTNTPAGNSNWGSVATSATTYSALTLSNTKYALQYGSNGVVSSDADLLNAYSLYTNAETYDIALVPVGKASTILANAVIAIIESRKDSVVFVSPQDTSTNAPIVGATTTQENALLAYANAITSSSYAVIDSGYKYQYDRYNDVYRYVPLNGDIAGLCARADYTNDPWWSPAGYTRGQIKNAVKLAFNPSQTNRDNLFKARINPVVAFPGQGTLLFGDKTALAKPSAFDAIGVRRLFIILEKAIATASKQKLFEFNDDFTRSQFRSMVEPYLRDVQGRRGISEFLVVCDATNNTADIIDSNNFVASIYVKPTRSIRYITLNFVATRSGISFSEVGA